MEERDNAQADVRSSQEKSIKLQNELEEALERLAGSENSRKMLQDEYGANDDDKVDNTKMGIALSKLPTYENILISMSNQVSSHLLEASRNFLQIRFGVISQT